MQYPLFLNVAGQQLHVSLFLPADGVPPDNLPVDPELSVPTSWVMLLPPFAEELNKSRRQMAETARALAADGQGVLLADFSGTGDSEGNLEQTSWSQWLDEALQLIHWLRELGCRELSFLGIRLGALMALDVSQRLRTEHIPGLRLKTLVFWQPVFQGKQFITQFLRLRLAADALQQSSNKTSVASLREELSNCGSLEVAGYVLNPQLVREIEALSVDSYTPTMPCALFEVVSNPDRTILPLTQKVVDGWQTQQLTVLAETVIGEPFWSTQEIAEAPALTSATRALFSSAEDNTERLPFMPAISTSGERALKFQCRGDSLVGVLHQPKTASRSAVVIVVGGPQYRVGSHRQFVALARELADQGHYVLRFDYRGMGDSSGAIHDFEQVDADIKSAIDALLLTCPHITELTLWGLCDAASAIAFYAARDSRVKRLVLLNPWVRSDTSHAKAQIKHYYLNRLRQPDFWKKLTSGNLQFTSTLSSLLRVMRQVLQSEPASGHQGVTEPSNTTLFERVLQGLKRFDGEVLLILSGNDLTAAEFKDCVAASAEAGALLTSNPFSVRELQASDHTFSRKVWKEQVARWTAEWLPNASDSDRPELPLEVMTSAK